MNTTPPPPGRDRGPAEAEGACPLTRLYRDHAAPEPSPAAWADTLDRINARLTRPAAAPRRPWAWRLALGLAATAAALGGLAAAAALWPAAPDAPPPLAQQQPTPPAPAPDDEVFPVASAGEIEILSLDPRDADRVALGVPLLGTFALAEPADIEVIEREPDPDDGMMPRVHGGPGAKVPLVVAAAPGEQPDEEE